LGKLFNFRDFLGVEGGITGMVDSLWDGVIGQLVDGTMGISETLWFNSESCCVSCWLVSLLIVLSMKLFKGPVKAIGGPMFIIASLLGELSSKNWTSCETINLLFSISSSLYPLILLVYHPSN